MKEQERLHGFVVVRVRNFTELGGDLVEMEHEKTGAKLAWLDRPDSNKSFSIVKSSFFVSSPPIISGE